MNDETWLTAADAGKVLRVTPRQVHRYAEQGQLVTRRAGRRTLFSAASVAQLADDLAVDIRPPAAQSRDLIPAELIEYMRQQAELMRQQGESQASIDRRLAAIEQQVSKPPAPAQFPPIVLGLLVGLVVLVAVLVVVLIWRGL